MKKQIKLCIPLIMSFISYATICIYGEIKSYSLISWLILVSLIILFQKSNISNKIMKKEIVGLSLLFSFLTIFGGIAYNIQSNNGLSIFHELINFKNLFYYIGIFNLFFIILTYIIPKLYNYSLKKNNLIIKTNVLFIFCFLLILLSWLPYFLNFYPGTLTPDSLSELSTIVNNFSHISDHHPVLHIIFISIPYNIGYNIFGSMESGIALSTFVQMSIMASIFSYSIVFLFKRNVNKLILITILCFYAFIPMHGYYSIVMWKDVIFAGSMLLLSMQTIDILEKYKNNNIKFKNMVGFILISLLWVFFRNNAIYMYFIFAIITLILLKKYLKIFIMCFIIIFGTYLFVKGPIFSYFNVQKSASVEYIGMPLQQIGRMVFKDVKFSYEETKLINDLMPIEDMKLAYNPQVSDGIKFNEKFNNEKFDNNKIEYFKLWLQLVFKHPGVAVEAYSISTLGYWYPGVEYWSVANNIWDNEYNIKTNSKLPTIVDKGLKIIEYRTFPILNIEWSIALCFWIILIFGLISFKINGVKGMYTFVPIFGIWLTMMIASPVYAEYRYVYGAYTSLPLLILSPYLIKNINSKGVNDDKK